MFKILHNIYDDRITEGLLQLSNVSTTRGHFLKLATKQSRLEIRRNSFAIRVVKLWNALPEDVVMAQSVKVFESRLDKFWNNQPVKFTHKEELYVSL